MNTLWGLLEFSDGSLEALEGVLTTDVKSRVGIRVIVGCAKKLDSANCVCVYDAAEKPICELHSAQEIINFLANEEGTK